MNHVENHLVASFIDGAIKVWQLDSELDNPLVSGTILYPADWGV